MKFNIGDEVIIIKTAGTRYLGKTGKIVHIIPDNSTLYPGEFEVRIEGRLGIFRKDQVRHLTKLELALK